MKCYFTELSRNITDLSNNLTDLSNYVSKLDSLEKFVTKKLESESMKSSNILESPTWKNYVKLLTAS